MTLNLLFLALGLALLYFGGETLIRGAMSAANRLGVSPLLSGLVIVGFGTSSPELAVSVDAALHQRPDIAVGNVVGSNIGNILLILGLCAMISPMAVKPIMLRRDGMVALGAALLFTVLAAGGALGRPDAAILLAALTAYLVLGWWTERSGAPSAELHKAEAEALTVLPEHLLRIGIALVLGLALLIGGSQALLRGAVGIATHLGLSEAVIGLTVVAVGTSLPELTVSLIAALRRQADVAIGNILGSNIFNVLAILGVAAILQPLPLHPRILEFDQWVMVGVTVVLLVFLHTGKRLSRIEGALLTVGYVAYILVSYMAMGS